MILSRVAALSPATQSFLAAAAVLGQHSSLSTISSVAQLPDAQGEVDAAVAAGLLSEGALLSEVAFTHPLYRAAIYADLSPTNRRGLHARAAELVTGRARLAHRVAASSGPDEALADELEASARASVAAGDRGASAWALEQAAALSPASGDRERRLLDAAVVHLEAADTPAAARVLACCEASSARRDALTGLMGVFTGSPSAEGRLLASWQAHDPETEHEIEQRAPRPRWPTGWSSLVAPSRDLRGRIGRSAARARVRSCGPWHVRPRRTLWRRPVAAQMGWLCSTSCPSRGTRYQSLRPTP